MATISKIRKHSGWVIGSIGIAMLGFLVSDVFTSGKFGFMSHGPKGIAIVAGEDLEPKEFQTKYESVLNSRRAQMEQSGQTMSTIQEAQLNDQVWTEYVTEIINQKEYEKLGINVSGDEILDMVVVHPHKMALQILADPKTGEYNKDKWFGFIKNLDKQSPENKKQWLDLEDAFTKERCKEKYGNLVKNAMYVTDLEAKDNFIGQNKVATVDYVALFTNTIADKDVEVTDKDIEEYINKHKDRFKQEEARSIQYVAFEITPTKSDSDETKTWIDDQVKALRASVNDSAVALRSKGAFSPRWQHRGEFPLAIEEEIFSADTGHIIGPLYENGTYKVYKVSKVHDDSLVSYRGSHILLKTIGNKEEDSAATDKKIKDLLAQIKKGADFAKIATEQSQDQGSALKGGDLGWKSTRDIKDYDPRFGAALKRGKLGDLIVVRSVYGTHLIKITANPNRKAVKVAEVERKIQASDKTSKAAFAAASSFRAKIQKPEDFVPQVTKSGLTMRLAKDIKHNDKILPGLENPRDLTRWVYENENGSISAPLLITDKFVVAYLGKIKKEGTKSVEDAKEEVTPIIKNDKKKDKLVAKMQEALEKNNSLEGLAKALNTNVNSADNITYMNTPTPNLANEPALIGYIAGTKPKKVSPPIKGETAVFVVNVKSFSSVTPPATFPEKVPMMRNEQARAANEATNALRESADIKDYRFMFY